MIPKVIHYCWFGGNPLPSFAIKCIESWKNFFPDYKIKEWNESNFDVNIIAYTREAYAAKKYAFVSDYARFWILYNYGGIYFDTDVEVVKDMTEIISKGPFMGFETDAGMGYQNVWDNSPNIKVNPGLGFAANKNMNLLKELLILYSTLHYKLDSGRYNTNSVVTYTTNVLLKHNLKIELGIQKVAGFTIYPKEYFCPKIYYMKDKKMVDIGINTYSIHHYSATWVSKTTILKFRLVRLMEELLPRMVVIKIRKIWRLCLGKK